MLWLFGIDCRYLREVSESVRIEEIGQTLESYSQGWGQNVLLDLIVIN